MCIRSRGCETGITLEYLQALYNAYEDFIADISRVIPVIKVNWSEFRSAEEMADCIKEEYERIQNVRCVEFPKSGGQTTLLSGSPITVRSDDSTNTAEEVVQRIHD